MHTFHLQKNLLYLTDYFFMVSGIYAVAENNFAFLKAGPAMHS